MELPTLELRREPLPGGVDPTDAGAVRAWLQAALEALVVTTGDVAPTLSIWFAHEVVSARLPPTELGSEFVAAAHWHALGCLPGALRRLRIGTILRPLPGGGARRAAAAMEWEHHVDESLLQEGPAAPLPRGLPGFGARWWVAWRDFGGSEGGTGVLHGTWHEQTGVGLPAVEDPFREWLDAEDLRITLPPLQWESRPGPTFSTQRLLRAAAEPPRTAEGFAEEIGSLTDALALKQGVDSLWILAFHGLFADWWRVRGDLPCSVADALRNVATFVGADAIGLVFLDAHQLPDGTTHRAVTTVVEHAGQRSRRSLVLTFGEDGRPSVLAVATVDPIEVEPAESWLAAAPGFDLQLRDDATRGPTVAES